MIWKKQDKLRPTQPYLVLDMENFIQHIYLKDGISHFYSYESSEDHLLKVVPDGCIDITFEYAENGDMTAFICGSALFYQERPGYNGEVFGVRFLPGNIPAGFDFKPADITNVRRKIDPKSVYSRLVQRMSNEHDFAQRRLIFLEEYMELEKTNIPTPGRGELINAIKTYVYESDGIIDISEISDRTGYSTRYVSKVFSDEMGYSPKTFCKIIQFQRVLEFLNYGTEDKMTDAAVALGFYDQPQFIRDFRKFAGITPHKYQKLIRSKDYKNRITQDN